MSRDDGPLGPAEMLATLQRQQDRTLAETTVSGSLLYLVWGLALVAGNLAMFAGVDRQSLAVPTWSALVYAAGLTAAGVVTARHISRRTAGLQSPDGQRSMMWGLSWPVAFAAFWLVGIGLLRAGMDERGAAHYFAIAAMLVVGILYLGAGAVYRDWLQYAGGVVVLAGAGAAALVGLPAGHLVMAVICGGGLLVLAALCRTGVARGRT